jgi:hypothetical protein
MLAPARTEIETAPSLEEYAAAWRVAKAEEQAANGRRLEIERAMLELLPPAAPESVTKFQIGSYAIKVTRKLTRTVVDSAALKDAWDSLPDAVKDCFAWRAEPLTKAIRALPHHQLLRLAGHVEARQAKPSFDVAFEETK